jgi:hypothetical protein
MWLPTVLLNTKRARNIMDKIIKLCEENSIQTWVYEGKEI